MDCFRRRCYHLLQLSKYCMNDRSEIQEQLKSELDIDITADKINLPEDRPASECLAQVAEFLIENDYISRDDIPITSGHKRYIVNIEPKHQDGSEMFRYKTIAQGLYVETNFNKKGIKNKIRKLYRIDINERWDINHLMNSVLEIMAVELFITKTKIMESTVSDDWLRGRWSSDVCRWSGGNI